MPSRLEGNQEQGGVEHNKMQQLEKEDNWCASHAILVLPVYLSRLDVSAVFGKATPQRGPLDMSKHVAAA